MTGRVKAAALHRQRLSLIAILSSVLALSGLAPAQAAPGHPGRDRAWREIWSSSFSGSRGAGVNRAKWSYDTGRGIFGTGEIEAMTSSPRNVALTGTGVLMIRAVDHSGYWTSGRIQTRRAFAAPAHGELRVSAYIRQPEPSRGLGYWPAFWLLGRGRWPESGEIDVMEDVNALSRTSATLHCGNLSQRNRDGTTGPCHEYRGLTSGLLACRGCQAGYHTYTVVIDRRREADQRIAWYLDGRETFVLREQQVAAAAWRRAVDHGLRIIFDLAIGGGYPDAACTCQTPTGATTPDGTLNVGGVSAWTRA